MQTAFTAPRFSQALRVLMVTPRYFPYMGGVETHVYEVSRRLVHQGVDVTVLTTLPEGSGLPRESVSEDGVTILRVPVLSKGNDFYLAPEMYRIITEGDWQVVHCQGVHTTVPALAMLAARKAGIPFVLTFHTGGHSSTLRNKIRNTQWELLRPLLSQAEQLIGVSQFETENFRKTLRLPAEQFTVIPNGAKLPALRAGSVPPAQETLIVSVGRLERYKGHQHLIQALPYIRQRRPDARLLIVGAGPYEQTLRKLAEKLGVSEQVEIRSIPSGEREAMAALLSQASLVALMSEYEAHPIAVMEALSLQRPVLGMHVAGLQELAEQGLIRSVSVKSTPQEIAEAALSQIEHPLISLHFALPTWESCAEKLLDVYYQIVPQHQLQVA